MICKICGSDTFDVLPTLELYCTNCGLVASDVNYTEQTDYSIIGQQAVKSDNTYIAYDYKFSKKLRQIDNESKYTRYHNFERMLQRVCEELGVSKNIQEDSIRIYKKSNTVEINWASLREKVVACLYIAHQINNTKLNYMPILNIRPRKVGRLIRMLYLSTKIDIKVETGENYLPELFRKLQIPRVYYPQAVEFIKKVHKYNITATPTVIAATAIYHIVHENKLRIKYSDIQEYTGRGTASMRILYKKVMSRGK